MGQFDIQKIKPPVSGSDGPFSGRTRRIRAIDALSYSLAKIRAEPALAMGAEWEIGIMGSGVRRPGSPRMPKWTLALFRKIDSRGPEIRAFMRTSWEPQKMECPGRTAQAMHDHGFYIYCPQDNLRSPTSRNIDIMRRH